MSDDLQDLLARARARSSATAASARILRLDELVAPGAPGATPAAPRWSLDALRGRLIELSARGATATLTAAFDLILEAQHAAEPVAWVTFTSTTFYPPDAADTGIDL